MSEKENLQRAVEYLHQFAEGILLVGLDKRCSLEERKETVNQDVLSTARIMQHLFNQKDDV